ncbi:sugar transporter [Fusarium tjaetaba]|uniref:Sugar transporter n=1 Tax=Fusarium tjaetaba TaxID=1567544 RepID=A0A8H5VL03_9HYPO|nr:sugar transporter [Fusarium tjaetaba]KAF5627226.1 sugar transporter [Fusarium tjaetaba]
MASAEEKIPGAVAEHADITIEKHETAGHESPVKEAFMVAASKGQGLSGYETLSLWETCKAFKVCTAYCFLVAFSAATDGYQIGINGNIIANPGFVRQFATKVNADGDPTFASPILSAWSAIMSVGQIIGMSTLPFISDRFGRKTAMYSYWLILCMSVLAESLARTWPVWLIAKLLAGIGVGCLQSTVPTYIAETAPVRIRGGLLIAYSFWFALGAFFAPVALQKSLRRLHWEISDYDIDHQYELLVMAVNHEMEVAREAKKEKWYNIFRGTDGRRTLTALWTLMTQQFIGLTLFSTFASYFFQQAGIKDPFQATCITSAINILANITMILTVDRLGRRNYSCGGSTLSWLSCVAIGILGVAPRVKATDYLFLFFACLWNVGITANGATGWGFIGEISSQRLRSYTAGFGAASTCVAGVIMNVLTPYMVNANEWNWELKTAWFYAGIGLPFVVGMWLLIPETKGRSAAELDELFESKVKPWRFHKTQTATQTALEAHQGGYNSVSV